MKGIEEIKALLQTWPEGFKHTFGREITKEELLAFLKDRKAKLELKSMEAQFSTYNPVELQMMVDYLSANDVDNIADGKKRRLPYDDEMFQAIEDYDKLKGTKDKSIPKKKKGK